MSDLMLCARTREVVASNCASKAAMYISSPYFDVALSKAYTTLATAERFLALSIREHEAKGSPETLATVRRACCYGCMARAAIQDLRKRPDLVEYHMSKAEEWLGKSA